MADEYTLARLLKDLDSDYQDDRLAAVTALGKSGQHAAVEPLISALGDGDLDVRVAAAGALGALGHPDVVEPLIKEMKIAHPNALIVVVRALGALGNRAAVVPLVAALEDSYKHIREAAAESLGTLVQEWKDLVKCSTLELVDKLKLGVPYADAALLYRTHQLVDDLRYSSKSEREHAAKELCQIASLCPSMLFKRWQTISDLVREPHGDCAKHTDRGDPLCLGSGGHTDTHHEDRGIGLDFPKRPPVNGERDF